MYRQAGRLEENFVVVTGAGGGIGLEVSKQLREAGFTVFGGVRSVDSTSRLETLGIVPLALDVTDESSIKEAVRSVGKSAGTRGLFALVNNAGIAVGGPWEHVSLAAVRNVLDVNFLGAIAVTCAFLPLLRKAPGRIVNVSSVAGSVAYPFNGPYSASKSALDSFSDSLRRELRSSGIRVSSVQPGPVATPLWHKFRATFPSPDKQPLYAKRCARYLCLTSAQEQSARSAASVASAICKVVVARNPQSRIVLGTGGRLALRLQMILPERWHDFLIAINE